jgi:hypothetical protein
MQFRNLSIECGAGRIHPSSTRLPTRHKQANRTSRMTQERIPQRAAAAATIMPCVTRRFIFGRTLNVEAPPRRSPKTKNRLIGGCLARLVRCLHLLERLARYSRMV